MLIDIRRYANYMLKRVLVNKNRYEPSGFTMVEMVITLAVIAVVAAMAAPAFTDFFDKNRLKRAAESVYGLIAQAKAEAVVRDEPLIVSMTPGSAWCVGYAKVACDCSLDLGDSGACVVDIAGTDVLQTIKNTEFVGVTMTETFGGSTTFNNVHYTVNNGSIILQSGTWGLNVVVSNRGRVRVCASNATKKMGYNAC